MEMKEMEMEMETEYLIELAMEQEMAFDEMIELLPVFKGIEKECNNKEFTFTKIYLLGMAAEKKKKEKPMNAHEFIKKIQEISPKERKIIKSLIDDLIKLQKYLRGGNNDNKNN